MTDKKDKNYLKNYPRTRTAEKLGATVCCIHDAPTERAMKWQEKHSLLSRAVAERLIRAGWTCVHTSALHMDKWANRPSLWALQMWPRDGSGTTLVWAVFDKPATRDLRLDEVQAIRALTRAGYRVLVVDDPAALVHW